MRCEEQRWPDCGGLSNTFLPPHTVPVSKATKPIPFPGARGPEGPEGVRGADRARARQGQAGGQEQPPWARALAGYPPQKNANAQKQDQKPRTNAGAKKRSTNRSASNPAFRKPAKTSSNHAHTLCLTSNSFTWRLTV